MEITKAIATSSNKKNVSDYNHHSFEVMQCFITVPPVSRFTSSLQVPVSLDHWVSYSRFSFPAKFPAVLENFLITFSSFLLSWQNTTQNNYGANKNNVNLFFPPNHTTMQNCKHRCKRFAPHLSQQIKIPSTLYEESVDSKNRVHWSEVRLEAEFQSKVTVGLIKS